MTRPDFGPPDVRGGRGRSDDAPTSGDGGSHLEDTSSRDSGGGPRPPGHLLAALEEEVSSISEGVRPDDVDQLREFFRRNECPTIDYDDYGTAFVANYFWDNFWKYFVMFRREQTDTVQSVLDLGGGGGATSTALVGWLSAADALPSDPIQIVVVDKSAVQLRLADRILRTVELEVTDLQLDVEFVHSDLADWSPESADADVALLGHLLGENSGQVDEILETAVDGTTARGEIFAVERPDDPVWDRIRSFLSTHPLPRREGGLCEPRDLFDPSGRTDVDNDLTTRYCVVTVPPANNLYELVDRYFEAWRSQSTDLLSAVFADDATYRYKPFERPLEGIAAIRSYWTSEVLPQADPQVDLRAVAYEGRSALVEWEARFGHPADGHRTVRGTVLVESDAGSDRIDVLREYYDVESSRGGRPDGR